MTKPITDKAEIALEYPDKLLSAHSSARHDFPPVSIRPVFL
jgi:hypothetical protein